MQRNSIIEVPTVIRMLFFILILVFVRNSFSFAQEGKVSVYSLNTNWLGEDDLKKWDKLTEQHKDADVLLNRSNDEYLEYETIVQDNGLSESKRSKKAKQHEEKAIEYYVKALKEYEDIYTDMLILLEDYLGDEEKKHPAFIEQQYFSEQAGTLYNEAGKAETELGREKLANANEMALNSIEKGITIFTSSPNEYQKQKPQETLETEEATEDLVINRKEYERYQKYISDTTIPDPVVVSQLMELEGDEASFKAFKEMWDQYQEDKDVSVKQDVIEQQISDSLLALEQRTNSNVADKDFIPDEEVLQGVSIQQEQEFDEHEIANDKIEKESDSYAEYTVKEKKETNKIEDKAYEVEDYNKVGEKQNSADKQVNADDGGVHVVPKEERGRGTTNVSIEGYEFRVQVAASKTQMTLKQIGAIYSGDLTIVEFKEGSFYRYQVRAFRLFSDAQASCSVTGVENAYIEAYKESKRIPLIQAVKETRELEQLIKTEGRLATIQPVEFSVQIAASRIRLSEEQILSIYSGNEYVSTVFEEGWYKYQVFAGGDLNRAFSILENCGVKRAFLVAYINGRKQVLYKALHEYKKYRQ